MLRQHDWFMAHALVARILFAFMVGIAIWLLLAAMWPAAARRAMVGSPAAARRDLMDAQA